MLAQFSIPANAERSCKCPTRFVTVKQAGRVFNKTCMDELNPGLFGYSLTEKLFKFNGCCLILSASSKELHLAVFCFILDVKDRCLRVP